MGEIKIIHTSLKEALTEENIKASKQLINELIKKPNVKIGYIINPLFKKEKKQ